MEIKTFAPATIANLGPGYDVLGIALRGLGDVIRVRETSEPGVRIKSIIGPCSKDIPLEIEKNTAGLAASKILASLNCENGIEMDIEKGYECGGGLGSSAASAAGAVVGINHLLNGQFSKSELVEFATYGEQAASDAIHADNVAPAVLGGLTIVASYDPLKIIRLNPPEIDIVVIKPKGVLINTREARAILPKEVPLSSVTHNSCNLATMMVSAVSNDVDQFCKSVNDVIVEPYRGKLITGFDAVKKAALDAGAGGCSIAGSGPAVFSFVNPKICDAKNIVAAMKDAFAAYSIECESYISKPGLKGATVIK